MYYTKCALSEYEVCGCGLMNFLLHVTQCFGWIFIYKLDTYLILPNVVSNFYYRMGFRHDPKMSTRNELAPFCIIFYLTDLMILNKINPMSINWKATNIRVDKLYDGSWRYIIHHNKSVITESFTPEGFFPYSYVPKFLMMIWTELLNCLFVTVVKSTFVHIFLLWNMPIQEYFSRLYEIKILDSIFC